MLTVVTITGRVTKYPDANSSETVTTQTAAGQAITSLRIFKSGTSDNEGKGQLLGVVQTTSLEQLIWNEAGTMEDAR